MNGRGYLTPSIHLRAALERADRTITTPQALAWISAARRPFDPADGVAFRARMERRVTNAMEHAHAIRTAPDEVVHRRVNGDTVIARRFLYRRTKGPSDHDDA